MNPREAAQVTNALTKAGLRFTPVLTEESYALWADALRDIPIEVGLRAVRVLIASDTDWPPVARFREVAKLEAQKWTPANALEPADRRCGECLDLRFVEMDGGAVRPCSACMAESFERWDAGAYRVKRSKQPSDYGATSPQSAKVHLERIRESLVGAQR